MALFGSGQVIEVEGLPEDGRKPIPYSSDLDYPFVDQR